MRIKFNIFFILFLFTAIYFGFYKECAVIFISVLLHELGHVLAGTMFHIKTKEIELFPFGSVAKMENISKYGGSKELIVSSTGPLVSVILSFSGSLPIFNELLSGMIKKYNLAVAFFNFIPALPLDGGRVVRNMLTGVMGYRQSTKLMVLSGKLVAIGLTIYNITLLLEGTQNISFIIAAIFIYTGATKEMQYSSYIYLMNQNNKKASLTKKNKIHTRKIKGYEDTYIRHIVNQLGPGDLCIIEQYDINGKIVKILSEADIMDGFLRYGFEGKIGQIKKI